MRVTTLTELPDGAAAPIASAVVFCATARRTTPSESAFLSTVSSLIRAFTATAIVRAFDWMSEVDTTGARATKATVMASVASGVVCERGVDAPKDS